MRRRHAALMLGAGLLAFVTLATTPIPARPQASDSRPGDMAVFETMLSRVRAGEPYYSVFGDELRRGHYPARSVFNWRTPLLLSALARVPDVVGRGVLILLGIVLSAAAIVSMAGEGPGAILATGTLLAGTMVAVLASSGLVLSELWAGLLIGLSVCMYGQERPRLAIIIALTALFVRELAAPYCVVCTLAALISRRWREVVAWSICATLYALYYGWHVSQVLGHQLPTDLGQTSPWLEFGGLASLLGKARFQPLLLSAPPWVTALALTVVLAGVVAVKAPIHVRITSLAYILFFLIAGQPINDYWGLVAWPTWTLALGFGLHAMQKAGHVLILPELP